MIKKLLFILLCMVLLAGSASFICIPKANVASADILSLSPNTIVSPDGWEWQSPLSQGNHLRSIWGSSGSDIFAVGEYGTILYYNGTAWSRMASGTTHFLNSVWGSSSSDVFVVGELGTVLHLSSADMPAQSPRPQSWQLDSEVETQNSAGLYQMEKLYGPGDDSQTGNCLLEPTGSAIWLADRAALSTADFPSGEWKMVLSTDGTWPFSGDGACRPEIGYSDGEFHSGTVSSWATHSLKWNANTGSMRIRISARAMTVPRNGYLALRIANNDIISHVIYTETGKKASKLESPNGDPGYPLSTTISTHTELISSPNPSSFGETVNFTASVETGLPDGGIPAGLVVFRDENRFLGTGMLDSSGQATYSTSSLLAGNRRITAQYSGDDGFEGSTSEVLVQEVNATFPMFVGDANGDGDYNAIDLTKVERIICGFDEETSGADANSDGAVNAIDITIVERIIAGIDPASAL